MKATSRDAGVLDDCSADALPVNGDDVEHATGNSDLGGELGEDELVAEVNSDGLSTTVLRLRAPVRLLGPPG